MLNALGNMSNVGGVISTEGPLPWRMVRYIAKIGKKTVGTGLLICKMYNCDHPRQISQTNGKTCMHCAMVKFEMHR